MKERNIVIILWPKYKQTDAEEYYLEEEQRARSETENSFPRNKLDKTVNARKAKYTDETKNIEGSYRRKHKPPNHKAIINPTK